MKPPPLVDIGALENKGYLVINDHLPATKEKTLIVLGVARSGTTMVAGVLHHLGVDVGMGDKPNTVFEDVVLAKAMEAGETDSLQALIAERDQAHAVWGWKRPSALQYIEQVQHRFRNPTFIVLFRDIFAIANRNRISVRSDVFANMEDSLRQYQQLLSFVRRCESRALLLSYEKAMLRPLTTVTAIAQLAGVRNKPLIRAARQFVRQNAEEYLLTSRSWIGAGRMEQVAPRQVFGWATMRGKEEPVRVELWVNDRCVADMDADLMRDELKGKAHPTGRCGFHFKLPDDAMLKEGDIVRARIRGEVKDLNGSPREFTSTPAKNPP